MRPAIVIAIVIILLGLHATIRAEVPASQTAGKIAPKPLFRDPIQDGAADPTVIWNAAEKKWFLFYTNRRAKTPAAETPGVTWVHGTRIGIAESSDEGATWSYRGVANVQFGDENTTQWAPEVIAHDGTYHMYLTIVPGIFNDWKHPRDIIHLTSSDLLKWKYESTLKLSSERVIDPCVMQLPDGTWRMWYNDEIDKKSIHFANSPDLFNWTDAGKAKGVAGSGEGPNAFRWNDHYWMLVDHWKGLGVYRSDDATNWTRQADNLLKDPGTGEDDEVIGGHPGVVVSNDRAYCFYFTHPGRSDPKVDKNGLEARRSSIQVVELKYSDGWLNCDRDQPTHILLAPR